MLDGEGLGGGIVAEDEVLMMCLLGSSWKWLTIMDVLTFE